MEFKEFPKIARLSREIIVTEKLPLDRSATLSDFYRRIRRPPQSFRGDGMNALITKCCNFVFYGWNHSPEHAGRCRACNGPWIGARNAKPEDLK